MGDLNFDLFGNPVPRTRGKPGRDEHVATAENAHKIRLLMIAGLRMERIAKEIGISVPTLRKHYFQNGKVNVANARANARAEQSARLLFRLDEQVEAGSVAAIKEMRKIIDEGYRRDTPEPKAQKAQAVPRGIKEERKDRARSTPATLGDLIPGQGDLPH